MVTLNISYKCNEIRGLMYIVLLFIKISSYLSRYPGHKARGVVLGSFPALALPGGHLHGLFSHDVHASGTSAVAVRVH